MSNDYTYNDNTPMPFGKYKGTRMGEVPPGYLIYLIDEMGLKPGKVRTYIEQNLDKIRALNEKRRQNRLALRTARK